MNSRAARLISSVVCAALVAPPLHAQNPNRLAFAGLGASAIRNADSETRGERLSGVTLGVEGTIPAGPLSLHVRYLEGNLSPSEGVTGRDIVEGEFQVGLPITRWLTVKTGPHIRSYVTGDVTERWIFWEGRTRSHARLLTPESGSFVLRGYGELWLVFASSVNVPESFDSGRGMEGGLEVRFARTPIWARLAYRVDRANLGNGARKETVEQVILAVGVTR